MVFLDNFGIMGKSWSACMSSSSSYISKSYKSERESLLTSLLSGGCEQSPLTSSISCMGSSLNYTLLSMKVFWDEESNSLYPFTSSTYPTIMDYFIWFFKALLFSGGILAQAFEPKTLKLETLGFWPLKTQMEFSLLMICVELCYENMYHNWWLHPIS